MKKTASNEKARAKARARDEPGDDRRSPAVMRNCAIARMDHSRLDEPLASATDEPFARHLRRVLGAEPLDG